jgi:hypothetical protein
MTGTTNQPMPMSLLGTVRRHSRRRVRTQPPVQICSENLEGTARSLDHFEIPIPAMRLRRPFAGAVRTKAEKTAAANASFAICWLDRAIRVPPFRSPRIAI